MNLKLKKSINPSYILALVFILVICWEAFLIYSKVYSNLSVEQESVESESIVRLDLNSYSKALILLDGAKSFVAPVLSLKNSNPFK